MTADPAVIGVVIPARDEADRIERCLMAVHVSADALRRIDPAVDVRVVVVADACADHTVELLAGWPGVHTVISRTGRVGAARAVGVRHLLGDPAVAAPADRVWIANTDADSAVPPGWLPAQRAAARHGVALRLGTVRPDPAELDRVTAARWRRRHRLADGHRHVHGANLGVRADWYLAAGGFPDVPVDEDVGLAAAVIAAGGVVERAGAEPVLTSARLIGRAPAGMAGYLRLITSRPAACSEPT